MKKGISYTIATMMFALFFFAVNLQAQHQIGADKNHNAANVEQNNVEQKAQVQNISGNIDEYTAEEIREIHKKIKKKLKAAQEKGDEEAVSHWQSKLEELKLAAQEIREERTIDDNTSVRNSYHKGVPNMSEKELQELKLKLEAEILQLNSAIEKNKESNESFELLEKRKEDAQRVIERINARLN